MNVECSDLLLEEKTSILRDVAVVMVESGLFKLEVVKLQAGGDAPAAVH